MNSTTQPHSVFWLGESLYRAMGTLQSNTPEYAMLLSSIKKGVANYVRIVTGRDIPVHFNKGKQSFATADDRIIIAASDDPEKIDVNVGLALHEAAHLRLSKKTSTPESIPLYSFLEVLRKEGSYFISSKLRDDMLRLNRSGDDVIKEIKLVVNVLEDRRIDQWMYSAMPGYRPYYEALYDELWHNPTIDKALRSPLTHRPLLKYYRLHIINLTNVNAHPDYLPGLRDIWNLINLPTIHRLSNDPLWETWQKDAREYKHGAYSYNAEKMPELLRTAIRIVEIMYANAQRPDQVPDDDDVLEDMAREKMKVSKPSKKTKKKDEEPEELPDEDDFDSDDSPSSDDSEDSSAPTDEEIDDESGEERSTDDVDADASDVDDSEGDDSESSEEENGGDVDSDEDDSDEGTGDESDDGSSSDSSDREVDGAEASKLPDTAEDDRPVKKAKRDFKEDDLDKAMQSQEKLLEGEVEKEQITEAVQREIEAVESSGAELKSVGDTFKHKCTCIVYNLLTNDLLRSPSFAFTKTNGTLPQLCASSVTGVKEGEQLGNILAHRLRIMADENTLIYTRQQHGKLDKRLISGLGYGAENVFNHSLTERMDPVMLHLSLDASTSMEGEKWKNAMMLATALAKAAEKVRTLEVVITMRSGDMQNRAQIAVVYDSRKDRFTKVRQMFPYLHPHGGTPEGLSFEAIKEKFLDGTRGVRRYFVNISDGEPCFFWSTPTGQYRYEGETAWTHTARQVKEFRDSGITVLSYFVHGHSRSVSWYDPSMGSGLSREDYSKKAFTAMYGRDAAFIDVKNMTDIARTLNGMFLNS